MAAITSEHWLPIDAKHSSVNGSNASTKDGNRQWGVLDWNKGWWIDGMPDCDYFHVTTKAHRGGEVYRVRCRYYPGSKWKGKVICSIGIGSIGGKLHWIVRLTEGK